MPATRPPSSRRFSTAFFLTASLAAVAGAEVFTLSVPPGASTVPGGISVAPDGVVYSADFGGSVVFEIFPDGTTSVFARGFLTPSGNAFDAEGYLLQSNYADQSNQGAPDSISRVSPDGAVEPWVENLNGPVGIAVDHDGSLFVAMCNAGNVTRVAPDGTTSAFSTSSLYNCPNGITFDERGELFVVNYNDGGVIRVEADGTASLFATVPGGGNGHVTWVAGSLYVASRSGHQIWEVPMTRDQTAKAPRLVAGNGEAGRTDGPDLEARFNLPNAMARNAAGDTIYTNGVGGAVRAITLDLPRPKKPKKVKAEALDRESLEITWVAKKRTQEGFRVELRISRETDFEPVFDAPAGADTVELSGLAPDTTYEVRVVAYNGTGESRPSGKAKVTLPTN